MDVFVSVDALQASPRALWARTSETLTGARALFQQPKSFAVVEIALHSGRDNPTVKHADWIAQRALLEKSMRRECNEVLLCDVSGNILGMQARDTPM